LQESSSAGPQRPTLSLGACSRIISEHGGRILIQQSGDGYVAFRVELPVAVKSTAQPIVSGVPTRAVAGSSS
jgi:K+-sensing histidine kinase KdpD